jgi:hypothetical protein
MNFGAFSPIKDQFIFPVDELFIGHTFSQRKFSPENHLFFFIQRHNGLRKCNNCSMKGYASV